MVLVNNLTQEHWVLGNYTDNTGEGISGTIYTENKMVNAKNLTGFTLKVRLYNQRHEQVFSDDAVILVAANGTWEYLPAQGKFNFNFIGQLELELIKSDAELTATGVNGSSKFRIR